MGNKCRNNCGKDLTQDNYMRNDGFCSHICESTYNYDEKHLYDKGNDARFREQNLTWEDAKSGLGNFITKSDKVRQVTRAIDRAESMGFHSDAEKAKEFLAKIV